MKILIVDDKHENLYMLEVLLNGSGYKTISAKNGAEALGLASKDKPDLIISDILMPLMDGYTLCREVKKDELLKSVPFIFYTATYTDPKDEEFALGLGADKFILKPVDPDLFLEIIESTLSSVKSKKIQVNLPVDHSETAVLKEYNEVLIRKLEDKMRQTEENEKKLKNYIQTLERSIEARKSTEAALLKAESKYKALFLCANDAIFLMSKDSFIECNSIASEMFGFEKEEILKYKPYELSPPIQPDGIDSKVKALQKINTALEGQSQFFEWIHKKSDETLFEVEVNLSRIEIEGEMLIQAIVRDITDRKQSERALKQAEERFRTVFQNTIVGLYRTTPGGAVLMANPALIKMLGFSDFTQLERLQLNEKSFDEHYPRAEFMERIEKENEIIGLESTWRKVDGSILYIRESVKAVRGEDGTVSYYEGAIEDITEKKMMEEARNKSEIQFRSVWEHSPSGMRITNKNGIVLKVNETFCKIFEITKAEIEGKPLSFVYFEKDREHIQQKHIERFTQKTIQTNFEKEFLIWNGKRIFLHVANSFLELAGEEDLLLCIYTDVTQRKIVEEERNKSEIQFRSIWEHSFDGMRIIEEKGMTVLVNNAFCKIVGSEKELLIGKPASFIFSKDQQEQIQNSLIENIKNLNIEPIFERLITLHDNRKVWLEMSNSFIEIGQSKLLLSITRDITKRKLAEEQIRKLSRGIEQNPAVIIITDIHGNIEYVNSKFTQLTGYTFDEVRDKNPRILKSGQTQNEENERLWETILSGNEWRGEFLNKKKSGELYWEAASISPIFDESGNITHFIAIEEDITKQKEMITELIEAKEKAEELNRVKSSFLANMSHELRTPLIAILGFSEILESELSSDPLLTEMVENIMKGGKRLLETVNLILNISRVESGKEEVSLHEIDIVPILKETYELFTPLAAVANLDYQLNTDTKKIICNIDDRLFRDIFNNLINNAIKFTESGSVKISVEATVQKAIIKIIDTGIGIPLDKQAVIWEEFRQVSEGLSRSFEGTGLGLTLVKNNTGLMKGTISLESEVGKGSAFIVEFPLTETTNVTTEKSIKTLGNNEIEQIKSTPKTNKNILYVEDDKISVQYVTLILKGKYNVDAAARAVEALEMLKQKKYDLILMDVNLSRGMDGVQLTEFIRNTIPEYKDVPIIAVTAYAMHGDKEEFLSRGMSGYISKPFSKKDMLSLLERVLS
jgi:PAS domain S-box-containing protein